MKEKERLEEINVDGNIISIHPLVLQPKSGLASSIFCLERGICSRYVTVMFYGVRLLASGPTPVNFGGPMIFLLVFTPLAIGSSFKALESRPSSHSHLLHNKYNIKMNLE
jgi:hypothetical protein